jgi:hypothetical protein
LEVLLKNLKSLVECQGQHPTNQRQIDAIGAMSRSAAPASGGSFFAVGVSLSIVALENILGAVKVDTKLASGVA